MYILHFLKYVFDFLAVRPFFYLWCCQKRIQNKIWLAYLNCIEILSIFKVSIDSPCYHFALVVIVPTWHWLQFCNTKKRYGSNSVLWTQNRTHEVIVKCAALCVFYERVCNPASPVCFLHLVRRPSRLELDSLVAVEEQQTGSSRSNIHSQGAKCGSSVGGGGFVRGSWGSVGWRCWPGWPRWPPGLCLLNKCCPRRW